MTVEGEATTQVRSSLPRPDGVVHDHCDGVQSEQRSHQCDPTRQEVDPDIIRKAWPEIRFYIGSVSLFFIAFALATGAWVLGPMVVLGWHSAAITSGSMEPAIQVGDVVVYSTAPDGLIDPGTVVVFPDSRGSLVTHRVVAQLDDGQYITRGDNNPVNDSTPVPRQAVRGVGRVLVPYAGYPAVWVSGGTWFTAVLVAAVFGGLSYASRWALLPTFSPWQDQE